MSFGRHYGNAIHINITCLSLFCESFTMRAAQPVQLYYSHTSSKKNWRRVQHKSKPEPKTGKIITHPPLPSPREKNFKSWTSAFMFLVKFPYMSSDKNFQTSYTFFKIYMYFHVADILLNPKLVLSAPKI